MPSVSLYMVPFSPPCRAVLLTASALGVDVEQKKCNPLEGDTQSPEFLKMNPAHAIPFLDDGGYQLAESRAIMTYLANAYGGKEFYPECPKARGLVDSRLYFDMSLWGKVLFYMGRKAFGGQPLEEGGDKNIIDNLKTLEELLGRTPWAAGDSLTLADHALAATVSSIEAMKLWDLSAYPKISAWLRKCEAEMKGYAEANGEPNKVFGEFIRARLEK